MRPNDKWTGKGKNRFAATCCKCGCQVKPGRGYTRKTLGRWQTIHASCLFDLRAETSAAVQNNPV